MGVKRAWRLKSESDVQRVWQQGGAYAHPLLIVRARKNGLDHSRVAFVVGKKAGGAVVRNRIKRRLREAVRLLMPRLAAGYDLVFIGRQGSAEVAYGEIERALAQVLERAHVLAPAAAGDRTQQPAPGATRSELKE